MRLNKKLNLVALILIILVFFAIGLSNIISSRPKNFNVLFITLDACRADHLSCYGYQLNTSACIDKLAKQGALFNPAIATSSFTATSLPSIMTATYSNRHGVRSFGNQINPSLSTLAQILKKNGYLTASISAANFFSDILGLNKGFDSTNIEGNLRAEDVTRKAVAFVEKNKNKKIFLWLHYFDTHEPYRPPEEFLKINFNSLKTINDKEVSILKSNPSDPDIYGGFGGVPDYAIINGRKDMGYYISLYDVAIKYVDEQIGFLLKKMEEYNLSKNTLIIITADHGESLGDHNLYFTHGIFLYDELIKVPLIINLKGVIPGNTIINQQVRTIDILPTILDVLNLRNNNRMDGISLLPIIFQKNKFINLPAFSEFNELKSIRLSNWKLIYNSNNGQYQLYNLINDPGELVNLVNMDKVKFGYLKSRLKKFNVRKQVKNFSIQLSDQDKQKLKSFGYLQ